MKFTLHSTRTCGESAHPEIVVPLDEALGLVPEWLLRYFESAVRSGEAFKAGQTVQIGGGLVKLHEGQGGTLELWEPDFKSMPMQFVRGANETLRQVMLQRFVAELVGAEPEFAPIRHAAQVPDYWSRLRVFTMHRNFPEGSHTGWSIEAADQPQPTHLISIYDLGRQLPICVPFFALPPGAHVEISSQQIAIEFAGRSASSKESELLSGLQRAAAL